MKKSFLRALSIGMLIAQCAVAATDLPVSEVMKRFPGAAAARVSETTGLPVYVRFRPEQMPVADQSLLWVKRHAGLAGQVDFSLLNTTTDQLGMQHLRYQESINGYPVQGAVLILHISNGKLTALNGDLVSATDVSGNTAQLSEQTALNAALQTVAARQYRWQVPFWEEQIKQTSGNPSATWYPKGALMYARGKSAGLYSLCYRFDVYAEQPLSRQWVFVNANDGKEVLKLDRIHHTNVLANALTGYSGTKEITTDSVNSTTYRLRETGRGQGIETYNLQNGTNYVNTDFTDADNYWNNVNAAQDQYATDAHWGAEKTYDFYWQNFGRNSIDNAGFKLLSYVHYSNNYLNAYWDGSEMTYGDGGNGYTPLTSLDIAGHEISHGLTEHTSNLNYQDESGAMNEAFSDCMGAAIRNFGKQSGTIDWLIGDEIGGTPFRNMANPNQYGQPDTYLGNSWYTGTADNGGVHTNSGVMNFWFYLLTMGGSGTNDNGATYNITGLGINKAAAICYRMNAVYLTSGSQYADARFYSIQAAIDLYGPCTPEVIATTNAWRAVGVGAAFTPTVNADFTAGLTTYCQAPATVQFSNMSTNAGYFTWYFGDGTTSTAVNPVHTYNNLGSYDVKLVADGASCGLDSVLQFNFVSVDTLNPCTTFMAASGAATTQTTCSGILFDSGGPAGNYADNITSTITIAPIGASNVTLTFASFALEDGYDYLNIYDGPSNASPQIGSYTGFNLPNGGIITSTGGSITIELSSDQAVNDLGFELDWQCSLSNVAPTSEFSADELVSCDGTIHFTDQSTNGPTSWSWSFGDGGTSTDQNPVHTYTANGSYTVELTTTNGFGNSTETKASFITINLPAAPVAGSVAAVCPGNSLTLTATGADSLRWFGAASGGAALATGGSYTTPALSGTTTYYVESDVYPASQHVGPATNSFGTGGYFTNTNYHNVVFDCFSPVRLLSVLVYAQSSGNRTITLMNSSGTTLATATVNIPSGQSRVTLNFDIPVGNNLELGIQGTTNLYRNQSGAVYPYSIANVISLTGSNAGSPGYYYFFYDWEVQGSPCISARTPVVANVAATPTAAYGFSANGGTISFTDQSAGATSWSWNFGDGNVSTDQHPVHTYAATGNYTVTLTVSNGTCSTTTSQTLSVTVIGIQQQALDLLTVYPNPAHGRIQFNGAIRAGVAVSLYTTDGRLVLQTTVPAGANGDAAGVSLTGVSAGAYLLKTEAEGQQRFSKLIVE